jgi:amino acid adenylation domain-containing protein
MNARSVTALAVVETVSATSSADQNPGFSPELNERQPCQIPGDWNHTTSDFPRDRCIHDLFAEQAALTPAAVAVVIGDKCLTYRELDRRSSQVAHYLQTLGVGPEVVVGLCLERSLEMFVGILGILKAGGAYLPLDSHYPRERLAYMLTDASVSLVLTSAEAAAVFATQPVRLVQLDLDLPLIAAESEVAPGSGATSDNLVYVMYTSGSSGKPKGVGIVHYNVTRLVRNTNYVQITPNDVFLQLAPITFDASTFEIWGALLNGAKLVLYPPDHLVDLIKLKKLIQETAVSILWLTAGLFHRIVDEDVSVLAPIKQLLAGGDVVSVSHVRRLLEVIGACQVINGYGPTEGTTFSVCFRVPGSSLLETTVPIGRPVSNTLVYVLDRDLEPVPVGSTGELYIGGAGLARGYFNRPDLSAESFIPDPFGAFGARLYGTGDMVRYLKDGVLEFVGRIDSQVKVRGHRIELEEVETAVLLDTTIRQAVVVALEDVRGDKRLVAYVVGEDNSAPDLSSIREHLKPHLPDYMIPSAVVVLKMLPLTPNGKIDRKALPAPEWQADHAFPQTPTEEMVAEVWKGVLGVSKIGLEDDFFDLGGTSLGLITVVMAMSERFALPLDTSIVTGGATVRALAHAVREKQYAAEAGHQEPGTPAEEAVAEIWAQILGVSKIGLEDDFFDLGGTSLGLITVVMKMSERFALPLDTSIVTEGATVRALAQAVGARCSAVSA